ncbi:MAG TPA: hypothetical protein VFB16_06730 [Bauldia sp.]|nr:hypothetical protein [Bauldia sp.]
MVIDSYNRSRFAEVYAVLLLIVALVVAGSALLARLGHRRLAAASVAGEAVARA